MSSGQFWTNCVAPRDDAEVLTIDGMETALTPLSDDDVALRKAVSRVECCNWETYQQVLQIIEAISCENPALLPATVGCSHKGSVREDMCSGICSLLQAWEDGTLDITALTQVEALLAKRMVEFLGEPDELKIWQVRQLRKKLAEPHAWQNLYVTDRQNLEPFHETTLATVIHDKDDGREAELSLAHAIDHLEICNWNFANNLNVIMKAIGGNLYPFRVYAAHNRNIKLNPDLEPLKVTANTLLAYAEVYMPRTATDEAVTMTLGVKTEVKKWLAASLGKTIQLQIGL